MPELSQKWGYPFALTLMFASAVVPSPFHHADAGVLRVPDPLFDGRWLGEGTHVTAAGSNALIRREIDGNAHKALLDELAAEI